MNTRWLIVDPARDHLGRVPAALDRDRVHLVEERAAKPDHRARDVHEQQTSYQVT